ncbi:hypothetical protein BLAT2472_40589 [Burkholderia latens]
MRTTDDVLCVKRKHKTGIIRGFQNAYAFDNNLGDIVHVG